MDQIDVNDVFGLNFHMFCMEVGETIAEWVRQNSEEFCAPEGSETELVNWLISEEEVCTVAKLSDFAYVDLTLMVGAEENLVFAIFIRHPQTMMLREVANGSIRFAEATLSINDIFGEDHWHHDFNRRF